MGIKDIIDKSGNNLDYYKVVNQLTQAITQLNTNHKIDVHNVYGSSNPISQSIDSSSYRPTKGIGSRNPYVPEDKKLITIQNPERLNTIDRLIAGEWGIEYMGRDLSLEEDNYRWDVYSEVSKISGYYIIERELIERDWLNVRWGRVPTNVKERKEVIDKSRLANPLQIRRDMIKVIMSTK